MYLLPSMLRIVTETPNPLHEKAKPLSFLAKPIDIIDIIDISSIVTQFQVPISSLLNFSSSCYSHQMLMLVTIPQFLKNLQTQALNLIQRKTATTQAQFLGNINHFLLAPLNRFPPPSSFFCNLSIKTIQDNQDLSRHDKKSLISPFAYYFGYLSLYCLSLSNI